MAWSTRSKPRLPCQRAPSCASCMPAVIILCQLSSHKPAVIIYVSCHHICQLSCKRTPSEHHIYQLSSHMPDFVIYASCRAKERHPKHHAMPAVILYASCHAKERHPEHHIRQLSSCMPAVLYVTTGHARQVVPSTTRSQHETIFRGALLCAPWRISSCFSQHESCQPGSRAVSWMKLTPSL